jgi:hypothetical protein
MKTLITAFGICSPRRCLVTLQAFDANAPAPLGHPSPHPIASGTAIGSPRRRRGGHLVGVLV